MAKVKILGTGPTLKFHTELDAPAIGVNDIWGYARPEYVLTVDYPYRFKDEARYYPRLKQKLMRLDCIKASRPIQFFSHLKDWEFMDNFQKIQIKRFDDNAQPGKIFYSSNSPFVAVSLAANMGFDEIVLYGVDFTNHKNFTDRGKRKMLVAHYRDYGLYLKKNNIKLRAANQASFLYDVLKTL